MLDHRNLQIGYTTARAKHQRLMRMFREESRDRPWDKIFVETDSYLVTPTLGSITPNWFLVWPKRFERNCWEWTGSLKCCSSLARDVVARLNPADCSNYLWFEHGSSQQGQISGCGVDVAHLHILVDPNFSKTDFTSEVHRCGSGFWQEPSYSELSKQPPTESYHAFGDKEGFRFQNSSDHLGSQFFRKVVARLEGKEREWDYKQHSFVGNVQVTLSNKFPIFISTPLEHQHSTASK